MKIEKKINRKFEIVANATKTMAELRAVGFSISYKKYLFCSDHIEKGSEKAILIDSLCRKGNLKKIDESKMYIDYDPLYRSLKDKVATLRKEKATFAQNIAESYNSKIESLYTSKRAYVMIQKGIFDSYALNDVDYNAYSKSYGYAAHWKNAAVVVRNNDFDIYTSRGKKVFTMKFPCRKDLNSYFFDENILLSGELFAIKKHGIYVRYNAELQEEGFAAEMQLAGYKYIEHGKTLQIIRKEYQHKLEIENEKRLKKEQSEKMQRAASLILRLCNNIVVSYDDARSVGYCNAGISAFCNRAGIKFSEHAICKLGTLKKYSETRSLLEYVSEKYAQKILN